MIGPANETNNGKRAHRSNRRKQHPLNDTTNSNKEGMKNTTEEKLTEENTDGVISPSRVINVKYKRLKTLE